MMQCKICDKIITPDILKGACCCFDPYIKIFCDDCKNKPIEQFNKEIEYRNQKIKELELSLKSAKGIRKLHVTREIQEHEEKIKNIKDLILNKN